MVVGCIYEEDMESVVKVMLHVFTYFSLGFDTTKHLTFSLKGVLHI